MKLESTIPEKAGFMYLAPVTDGLLLLIAFFVFFGSNNVLKSGVHVDLPASNSTLPSVRDTHVITVMKGTPPKVFFNEARVDFIQLGTELASGKAVSSQVTVLADRETPYGDVMEAALLALKYGYQVAFGTQPEN